MATTEEKKTEGLTERLLCVLCGGMEDGAEGEGGGGGDGPWTLGGWVWPSGSQGVTTDEAEESMDGFPAPSSFL